MSITSVFEVQLSLTECFQREQEVSEARKLFMKKAGQALSYSLQVTANPCTLKLLH
jgi:hypothetical protein